jgi:hypothetical protein
MRVKLLATCLALSTMGFAAGCGDDNNPSDLCLGLPGACTTPGATQCGPDNASVQTCSPGAGTCFQWTTPVACEGGQACVQGACQCRNECAVAGRTECLAQVVRTCSLGEDGCLGWVDTQDCASSGQACDESSGQARCATACQDVCPTYGVKRCQDNVLQTCGLASNGCLNWLVQQNCTTTGQVCTVTGGRGSCRTACQDECSPANTTRCSTDGLAIERCVSGADGCTDLLRTECDPGLSCRLQAGVPTCVLDCSGQCFETGRRCSPDGRAVEVCVSQPGACNAWSTLQACGASEICQVGAQGPACTACSPNCAGRECGSDGCGGECGDCPDGLGCNASGQCVPCQPDCAGRACGSDGCGGACGICPAGQRCGPEGQCVELCQDAVRDGSFEGGSPNASWTEASSQFGSPLCTVQSCGGGQARTGLWWAWYGGVESGLEDGSVAQDVTLPAGAQATLAFYLRITASSGVAGEYLAVHLGAAEVLRIASTDAGYTAAYTRVEVDLGAQATPGTKRLEILSHVEGGGTSFFVDDVSLTVCEQPACTDECDPLLHPACAADSTAVETCRLGADGCTDLVSTACPAGESCELQAGVPTCVPGCSDECLVGDYPACSGDAIDTCELGADGCTDLVSTACPAGESCELVAGVPTCVAGCSDECLVGDYPACSGDAIDTCELGADGCTDLVSTPCGAGETCELVGVVPTCVAGCSDECLVGDYPACSGDAIATCELGADGCTDLVSTPCPAGESCELQAGVPTCVAVPLPGDTCETAIVLDVTSGSASAAVDTTGLSNSHTAYSCAGTRNAADAWYTFTLTEAAAITLETSGPGSVTDTVMALFDACGGAQLACNDDAVGLYSRITGVAQPGTYYVVVEPYEPAEVGTFTLSLTLQPIICTPGAIQCNAGGNLETCNALGTAWVETVCASGCGEFGGVAQCVNPGDTCLQALALDLSSGSVAVDNASATNTYATYSGCSTGRTGFDVWHTFTLTDEADVVIETSGPGTVTDTILALFDGCGGTQLACNDDIGGGNNFSRITQRLPAGTYYVVSEPFNTTARGTWTLTVSATYRAPVTQWDFEDITNRLVPNLGTGTASQGPANTTPATFPGGFGGGSAWSLANWNTSELDQTRYFQLTTDLGGTTAVVFRFDHQRSNTGPTTFVLYVSTDGTTFTEVPGSTTATAAGGTWTSNSFDLSAILDNQAVAIVRLHAYGTTNVAGTWRVDNVTFAGF